MAKTRDKKLTDQQVCFCEEYLIHGVGSLAYKTAYPNCKTDGTARTQSSTALAKPNIKEYLKKRRAEMASELEITPEKILAAHARRAFFDPRKLLDPETGELIPMHRLPRDVAASITKLKVRNLKPKVVTDEKTGEESEVEQSIIEVEWDKGDSAREALSKVVGLYEKDHQQANDGLMTAGELIRAIRNEVSGTNLGLPRDEDMDIG